MRSEPTDDAGTLSVACRIDNTGAEPLIVLDIFGDPYTVHAPGEETGALSVAWLIEGNTGKTSAWVAAPTRRHMFTLGGRQTGHDETIEDDRGRPPAPRRGARRRARSSRGDGRAEAMGEPTDDRRLVWDPNSRLAETDPPAAAPRVDAPSPGASSLRARPMLHLRSTPHTPRPRRYAGAC